jgi:hypothetical protein
MATDKPERPDGSARPGGSPDQNQGSGHKAEDVTGNDTQRVVQGRGKSQGRSNGGGFAGAAVSGAVPGSHAAAPGTAAGAAKEVGPRGTKSLPGATNSSQTGPTAKQDGSTRVSGSSSSASTGPQAADGAADTAGKATDTAGKAGQAKGAMDTVKKAGKSLDGVAANAAGGAAQKAIEGKGDSKARSNAGRYAGAAASGAVAGAQAGAAAGGVGALPAANAANLVWGFIVGVAKVMGKAIAAPFVAIGGLAAKGAGAVFGVAVTATVAPVATATSGIIATITAVAVLSTVVTGILDHAGLDGGRDRGSANCVVTVGNSGPGADVPANTEANAKAVYSVLKSWGMSDENIAGILGNWSQESGIDPTSVEGIHNEPYRIGPRKQAAWDDEFTHIPGQSHGGIGLGQWSNGRTPMLLNYAQSKGLDWYTIEAQLAFMVEGDNPGDVDVFKGMIETSLGSPGAAARHFHDKWERSADNASMMAERVRDAEMWYGKMSGWEVDDSIVGGVEDIVGGIIDTIGGGVNTILGNCDNNETVAGGNLVDGGMNEEQAQLLVDLYNKEGDKFLDEKYGNGGGPGSCGDNHAMNCVSFSVYFVNKYTSFQQYPSGDGIQTAHSIASMTGKQVSDTPTAYSVGSGPGTGPAGHTLVVLGVDGDRVIIGEAGYCAHMGRVRVDSAERLKAEGWVFVDVSDLISESGSLPASHAAA